MRCTDTEHLFLLQSPLTLRGKLDAQTEAQRGRFTWGLRVQTGHGVTLQGRRRPQVSRLPGRTPSKSGEFPATTSPMIKGRSPRFPRESNRKGAAGRPVGSWAGCRWAPPAKDRQRPPQRMALGSLAQPKWRRQRGQRFPAFSKPTRGSDLAMVRLQVTV